MTSAEHAFLTVCLLFAMASAGAFFVFVVMTLFGWRARCERCAHQDELDRYVSSPFPVQK